MGFYRTTGAVIAIFVASHPSGSPGVAATREVCASGCAYSTIQSAVNTTTTGDTIMVLDPIHTEGGIVIGVDVTLAGDPANPPIVQASATPGVAVDRVLEITPAGDVIVQDLVIRHGRPAAGGGGGILNSGELRLVRAQIQYNDGNGSEGGGILSTGSLELVDSHVFANVADVRGGGISCLTPCQLTMLRTTVDGNLLNAASGISGGAGLYTDGPGLVESCLISDNVSTGGSIGGTGGGIMTTNNQLVLVGTDVVNNQAGRAGGISASGPLTVIRGSISFNTATNTGSASGGISCSGAPVLLESTVISGNTGKTGGGVQSYSAAFTMRRSAIVDNHASSSGGGLVAFNAGETVVEDSLIAGNTAYVGGGVAMTFAEVRLRDTTVSGNTADGDGGGIWVAFPATLSLSNVTVTDNTADPIGLSGVNGGGIYVVQSDTGQADVVIRNSIVAGNRDFSPVILAQAPDCAGPITVDGWLSLGGTGLAGLDPACLISGATPEIGGDQGLQPLADNGGPTMTHALTVGSPNIDTGDPTGCSDGLGTPLGADQRGGPRIATCDRGAYEYGATAPLFADDLETGGTWMWSASTP